MIVWNAFNGQLSTRKTVSFSVKFRRAVHVYFCDGSGSSRIAQFYVSLNPSILLHLIFTKWVNIYHLFVDKRTIFSEIVKSNGKLHMYISKMIGKIQ